MANTTEILKSLRCLTTFLRYLYESSTIHDGATTMLLRCYYGATTAVSRKNRRTVVLYSCRIGMNLDETGVNRDDT